MLFHLLFTLFIGTKTSPFPSTLLAGTHNHMLMKKFCDSQNKALSKECINKSKKYCTAKNTLVYKKLKIAPERKPFQRDKIIMI